MLTECARRTNSQAYRLPIPATVRSGFARSLSECARRTNRQAYRLRLALTLQPDLDLPVQFIKFSDFGESEEFLNDESNYIDRFCIRILD